MFEKYGREHFAQLGHKVGTMNRDERHVDFKAMGKTGGEATASRYDNDHFVEIGIMGGMKLWEKRGREYYQEIGRKGALSPNRKKKPKN